MIARALASPASLKGVLDPAEAATLLAEGFARAGVECRRLPIADGGDGTLDAFADGRVTVYRVHDAFGRPRDARVRSRGSETIVEAAQVIPLDPTRLDAIGASTHGLGELLLELDASRVIVGLGGTANMDGGAGLLEVIQELPWPTTVLCDVQTRLYDAPRLYGPQKGATPEEVELLERRLRARTDLAPFADVPGSGAAGGLGAAFAALGAELVPGAATLLDLVGFDPRGFDVVVTGEGTVDATTGEGKAPAAVARRCIDEGVRCVVFGGIVREPLPGVETVELSGRPERAREDLRELGERLGRAL